MACRRLETLQAAETQAIAKPVHQGGHRFHRFARIAGENRLIVFQFIGRRRVQRHRLNTEPRVERREAFRKQAR